MWPSVERGGPDPLQRPSTDGCVASGNTLQLYLIITLDCNLPRYSAIIGCQRAD